MHMKFKYIEVGRNLSQVVESGVSMSEIFCYWLMAKSQSEKSKTYCGAT
jgi:hypothetical protein